MAVGEMATITGWHKLCPKLYPRLSSISDCVRLWKPKMFQPLQRGREGSSARRAYDGLKSLGV